MVTRYNPDKDTDPLFAINPPEPRRVRKPAVPSKAKWAVYKLKTPTPCDACTEGQASGQRRVAALQARRIRTAVDGTRRYLCWLCAIPEREADGLEAFKNK